MANEARGSAVIIISGQRYDRVSSLTLKRSMEEGTCSGTIVLSWPGTEQFNAPGMVAGAFVDGADGQIILDGQLAGTITLDTRTSKGSPKAYELTLQFRGQSSGYVDMSPDHDTGQFNKKSPAQIMQELMKGGKGKLIDQSNFTRPIERFIIAEGESIERACRRAAREMGLTFWENPEGNWVLQSANTPSGAVQGELRLGRNFTNWSVKRDIGPRFGTYGCYGNGIPTDKKYGKACEGLLIPQLVQGTAKGRNLRVGMDGDHDNETLRVRAQMEASRRSGQGNNVTLKMSTWSDDGGKLWGASKIYHLVIPIDDVNEDMKLVEVEFELTATSRTATLTMMSAGAFGAGGNVFGGDQVQQSQQTIPPVPPPQTPAPPPPSGG